MLFFRKVVVCLLAIALTFGPAAPVFAHGNGEIPPEYFAKNAHKIKSLEKALAETSFMNFETPHVHPIDVNPAGTKLAVVNTAGAHVELYDIDGAGDLTHVDAIQVGVDPVTARWRTNTELWVVNQISDTISIIDTTLGIVTDTLVTYKLTDGDNDGDLEGDPNGDEPADVVFGTQSGNPVAVVSCSRTDRLQIWDLGTLTVSDEIYLDGEDPRSMAINTSLDPDRVYAAIFESGNSSTLIAGAEASSTAYPPNTAALNENNHVDHPYFFDGPANSLPGIFVINPPPNDGSVGANSVNGSYVAAGKSISVIDAFNAGIFPPNQSIIVKKDFSDGDKWKDDVGSDWTRYITGDRAAESGRFTGWDLLDNDIAIQDLDAGPSAATYATRQMNICMALNVNPVGVNAGRVYMVGTEATNEVRFEPAITGTFVRVMLSITEDDGTPVALVDLNEEHLDAAQGGVGMAYSDSSVPQSERNKSIGDPRGVAFSLDGATAYITGMGSNNVVPVNTSTGQRTSIGATIEVGHGPTGIVHHPTQNRLYVVNKFGGSVSVINTSSKGGETVIATHEFYDPTPDFINEGRVHTYGTHENSGLGQIACASCHIDSRMDRLAWDLGNPLELLDEFDNPTSAHIKPVLGRDAGLLVEPATENPVDVHNTMQNTANFDDFHPMKGPMTTQTLQDIIGKEPHHWRGDRDGIEQFAGAFVGLQGDDEPLSASKMVEFKAFLSSIHFPPNPFRPMDNTLPGGPNATDTATNDTLDMTGFFSAPAPLTPKSFSATGTPMETVVPGGGNAWSGFIDYVDFVFDSPFRCVDCHTLPIGAGGTHQVNGALPFTSGFLEIPPSTLGNAHQMMVSVDGTGQKNIKIPQLRNQIEKEGFFLDQGFVSRAGFGLVHDGPVDGLARFLSEPAFQLNTDQKLADQMAFTFAIGGADFDQLLALTGAPTMPFPPAAEDQTGHAAVGMQLTISSSTPSVDEQAMIDDLIALADRGEIDLVVKGVNGSDRRGWYRLDDSNAKTANFFQSDENDTENTLAEILAMAGSGTEMTFTAVPEGSGLRMGVDRDEDSVFDFTEIQNGTNPADPLDGGIGTPVSRPWLMLGLAALMTIGVGLLIRRRTTKHATA